MLGAFIEWLVNSPWPCVTIALLVGLECSPVVGIVIPGIVLLPAIGSLSGQGIFSFWHVLICAAIGALCADSFGYWLGRVGHAEWHRKLGWHRSQRLARRTSLLFEKYGLLALFGGRLMWVVHTMVPMAAGAFGVRALPFFAIDFAAALLWLVLLLGGGHGLGMLWLRLGSSHRILMLGGLLAVIAIVAVFARRGGRDR